MCIKCRVHAHEIAAVITVSVYKLLIASPRSLGKVYLEEVISELGFEEGDVHRVTKEGSRLSKEQGGDL